MIRVAVEKNILRRRLRKSRRETLRVIQILFRHLPVTDSRKKPSVRSPTRMEQSRRSARIMQPEWLLRPYHGSVGLTGLEGGLGPLCAGHMVLLLYAPRQLVLHWPER